MTSINQIWTIANEVRGAVDGWDFKHYVLGTLCYRCLSEDFTAYMQAKNPAQSYANTVDDSLTDDDIDSAIREKGYFIFPSQLFANIALRSARNDRLAVVLSVIFESIERSSYGYPSEYLFRGLFGDLSLTSGRLGTTPEERNSRLAKLLQGIASLVLPSENPLAMYGQFAGHLITQYASHSGIAGAALQTPPDVSELLVQLASHNQRHVRSIYDPAAGAGALLLTAREHLMERGEAVSVYGQELNRTTFNITRMNMLMNSVPVYQTHIAHGNTLVDPQFGEGEGFDVIVSNPPYSQKWIGQDKPDLLNDPRFAPAGILAPASKADMAFIMHTLHYLSQTGRAAILCHPGVLYRPGAERKIRQYLVEHNYVEAVVSLPANVIYGTPADMHILVLSKNKSNTQIQFIDGAGVFEDLTQRTRNIVTDDYITEIINAFDQNTQIDGISAMVDNEIVNAHESILSVGAYL